MGWFGWFGSKPDRLTASAKSQDSEAFQSTLLTTGALVLCSSGEIDGERRSEAEVLGQIETAIGSATADQPSFLPFTTESSLGTTLPVFSSQKFVDRFIQEYVNRSGKIAVFEVLGVEGYAVMQTAMSVDRCILNQYSSSEVDCTELFPAST